MKTAIDLPDDVNRAARPLADCEKISLGEANGFPGVVYPEGGDSLPVALARELEENW